jgi:CdiI N-terminal domain
MPFSIKFLNKPFIYPFDDPKTPAASGELTIGDSTEAFHSSLYHWSTRQYENQWSDAIRVLLGGAPKAALIVEYLSSDVASHLEWWAMYREGEVVYLQNQLLFYRQLTKPFSLDAPFASLRERQTINQEGQSISEWSVSLSEVEQFGEWARLSQRS